MQGIESNWVWTLIFIGIFVIAPALFGAAVLTWLTSFIARRLKRPLSRRALATTFGVLAAFYTWNFGVAMYERENPPPADAGPAGDSLAAGSFDFQPYSPRWLPPGVKLADVDAQPDLLVLTFESGTETTENQQSPDPLVGDEGRIWCPPERRGRCRYLTTPADKRLIVYSRYGETWATASIGDTIIDVTPINWTDKEIGRYFDSLRPVDSLEIDEFEQTPIS